MSTTVESLSLPGYFVKCLKHYADFKAGDTRAICGGCQPNLDTKGKCDEPPKTNTEFHVNGVRVVSR